jgi:hypothetical protein
VLVGASEGRADMRVFLRPVSPPQRFEADPPLSPPAGNGGSHPEASPFRELLTEFRNLTERYGQALLALGEARGEVAALRSRVDLLEARMDMRLPLRPASTVAWELSERPSPQEASTEAPDGTDAPAEPATMVEAAPEAEAESAQAPMAMPEPAPEPEAEAEGEPEAPSVPEAPAPVDEAVESPAEPPVGAETPPVPEVRVDLPEPAVEEPAVEEPAAEEPAVEEPAVEEPAERSPEPKRRVSGGRAAVAGLAEALARAEDPTLAALPGAREAADALAALHRDMRRAEPVAEESVEAPVEAEAAELPQAAEVPEAAGVAAEAAAPEPSERVEGVDIPDFAPSEPEEPPAVEVVAPAEAAAASVAEELPPPAAESPYTTEVVEPDWFADGDFTWLDAGEGETTVEGAPVPAPPEPAHPEPAHPEPEEPDEPEATIEPPASEEMEHVEREDEGPAADAIQDAFDEPAADESGSEPEATTDEPTSGEMEHVEREDEGPAADAIQDAFEEPAAEPEPPEPGRAGAKGPDTVGFGLFRGQPTSAQAAPEQSAIVPDRPTSARDEEALLWFGDEFEAEHMEVAAEGWREQSAPVPPAGPKIAVSDAELERIAAAEGWDSEDVDAIRSYLGRTAGQVADESPPPSTAATEVAPSETTGQPSIEGRPSTGEPEPRSGAESHAAQPWAVDEPTTSPGPSPDQDWLRGRRSPAAGAYRRLRRLFDS